MKNFTLLTMVVLSFLGLNMQAQDHNISASGNFGWAIPGGSGIGEAAEDLNLDGGIVYGIDALYHLTGNIGVGIQYSNALLAGAGDDDIDLFGMRFIGAKAHYRLKEEGFSPFVGLGLGLSQLLTPSYSITDSQGNTVTVGEETGSGFGIMPEFGLSFGKFFIMGQYLVPTSYSIDGIIEDKAAGTLNIMIGYRYRFSF